MVKQPIGTVTLVFTDIEGSTRLLQELGQDAYREALAEHRRVVREGFARHSGYEVDYEGDAFFYAFSTAKQAVDAVDEVMRLLEHGAIRIRVGMHTGSPGLDRPRYVGIDVHKAARIMSAAHGGQVLLSESTRALIEIEATSLGAHSLKDIPAPVFLYQLGHRQFPPLRVSTGSTLPPPTTAFVGRKRDLRELQRLFGREEVRLVTVTGAGGTGKTRLALEFGRRIAPTQAVLFVDLSAASGVTAPLAALATALGVAEQAKIALIEAVSTALAARRLLVILDNCEHLLAPVAGLVESLLSQTRGLRFLATSREPLHVAGEFRVALAPLSVPAPEDPRPERAEAVGMFLDRLKMSAPTFTADPAAIRAAGELVRALDGLPLAIELAAARAALLGVNEVRERLSDRFRILRTVGDVGGRHRSLEAAIDWSYELLPEPAQAALRTVSVFPASFSLGAAEAVIGSAALELIPGLADASLLALEEAGGGSYRYRLLDTIRAYASGKRDTAGETARAERRLADWARGIAESASVREDTTATGEALRVLDREGETLVAALAWALKADPPLAMLLTLTLFPWRSRRGRHRENADAVTAVLAANTDAPPDERARALFAFSSALYSLGEFSQAEEVAVEADVLFRGLGLRQDTVSALCRISGARRNQDRLDEAAVAADEALQIARQIGDDSGVVSALTELGFGAVYRSDCARAYQIAEDAYRVRTDQLTSAVRDVLRRLLAVAAADLGKFDEAEAISEAALAETLDDLSSDVFYRATLGDVSRRRGQLALAVTQYCTVFEEALEAGYWVGIVDSLLGLALVAADADRPVDAAGLLGALEQRHPPLFRDHADLRAQVQADLGRNDYTEAYARGSRMTANELLTLGRSLERDLQVATQ